MVLDAQPVRVCYKDELLLKCHAGQSSTKHVIFICDMNTSTFLFAVRLLYGSPENVEKLFLDRQKL